MKARWAISVAFALIFISCDRGSESASSGSRPDTLGASSTDNVPTRAWSADEVNRLKDKNTVLPATDQTRNESDRQLTQQIEAALKQNPQIGPIATKVKVITLNGNVTLRGAVHSTQEAAAIEQEVKKMVGTNAVENVLEVRQDARR